MRHRCLVSATLLLLLVFRTASTHAASHVLFSDDFEQHAVGAQLDTLKPVAGGGYVMTGFWDPARKLYVAFPKVYPVYRGHSR